MSSTLKSLDYDSDEAFCIIAGYTEDGIPFAVSYEEMEEDARYIWRFLNHSITILNSMTRNGKSPHLKSG